MKGQKMQWPKQKNDKMTTNVQQKSAWVTSGAK